MHLVRAGSLTGAADALDVSYTTVARRVKRAEDDLGLKLFDRLADGYQATEAGQVVAMKAAAMEIEELDLMRGLLGADQRLTGELTVTAPQLLCMTFLAPVFKEFTERYPDVSLQVNSANELLDLNRREADVAIRISNDPGDTLVGRRLTEQSAGYFGTQDWADRMARDPSTRVEWLAQTGSPEVPTDVMNCFPNARVRMRFDDFTSRLSAARIGTGIVRIPVFLASNYQELVHLSMLPTDSFPDVWMVAHRDVWQSARVAAFRDIMLPHFRKHRSKFQIA